MRHTAGLHETRFIEGATRAFADEGHTGIGGIGGTGRPRGREAPRACAGAERSHDRPHLLLDRSLSRVARCVITDTRSWPNSSEDLDRLTHAGDGTQLASMCAAAVPACGARNATSLYQPTRPARP